MTEVIAVSVFLKFVLQAVVFAGGAAGSIVGVISVADKIVIC